MRFKKRRNENANRDKKPQPAASALWALRDLAAAWRRLNCHFRPRNDKRALESNHDGERGGEATSR